MANTKLWLTVLCTVLLASVCCSFYLEPADNQAPSVTLKAAQNLAINIQENGNYKITQNGKEMLVSGNTFFQSRGNAYSTEKGNLLLRNLEVESGWDNLGEFTYVEVLWELQDCDFEYVAGNVEEPVAEPPPCTKSTVITGMRAYKMSPVLVFSQDFRKADIKGTSTKDKNKICTGFPTFQVGTTPKMGYMSYGGLFLSDINFGMWQNGTGNIKSGLYGGPLVLFDETQRTMVIGPLSEFMAASVYYNTKSSAVEWGVMGEAASIPKDFNYETVLVFGEGIKSTTQDYGSLLLKHHGKTSASSVTDFTSNYLGYWTDNGAYYYYKTAPNMNYDETLMQVKKYSDAMKIPYRYFQLDSWWYYKGADNGVKNWTARHDIFPNGLQDFYNRLGLPLVAHNRWWSNETQYAKANGGKWNFIVEKDNQKAIPQDQDFWNYLLSTSKEWGLIVYEQDWLNVEFEQMRATLQDVSVGRTWMNTMGAGASLNNMPIQLCMPMARHLLQSVEMPAVTQSRASNDYQPGNSQWNIGKSSILLHALALRPFKDNFWTTSVQSGNPYGRKETNPQLQSVVATLSTGPVGPADMLNHANSTLIMRSCNGDGKLLQPSRPAMTLSGNILAEAFGSTSANKFGGIIWSTVSEIQFGSSQINFGHILAIEVDRVTMLTPTTADFGDAFQPSMIYNDMDPVGSLAHFDEKTPLKLPPILAKDFQLWHTTPIMKLNNNTVLLLGELNKWVKVSPDRITDISLNSEHLAVSMTGAPNEKVTMTFMFNMKSFDVTCVIPESKKLTFSMMDSGKFECFAY